MIEKQESQQNLAYEKNFIFYPGSHTILSPVVGSRTQELELIYAHKEVFAEYQKVVYGQQKTRVIPLALQKEADKISKEILTNYIQKYRDAGLTVENAFIWNDYALTRIYPYDLENESKTWRIEALVAWPNDLSHIREGKYRPTYICALHELMHVEEIPKGILKTDYEKFTTIAEVLTVTRTLILVDETYKRVYGIPLEEEVDYDNTFTLFGKQIPQGRLANFYRQLETTHPSLADALVSVESLNFLGYNRSLHATKLESPQKFNPFAPFSSSNHPPFKKTKRGMQRYYFPESNYNKSPYFFNRFDSISLPVDEKESAAIISISGVNKHEH